MVNPKDVVLEPLTANKVIYEYYHGELIPYITYGDLGIGKSSHNIQATAIIYGSVKYPNWEKMKTRLVHKPIEFFKDCLITLTERTKQRCLVWEDAGVWLFASDYNDPLVKAITKYLNLARTRYGAILFNSPTIDMIIKKVRVFPNITTLKIIKAKDDDSHPRRERIARAFKPWRSEDGKKSGVNNIYNEGFYAMLPNDIYKWYMPIRESYEEQAVYELWKVLKDQFPEKDREELQPIIDRLTGNAKEDQEKQVYELLNLEPSYNV